MPFVRTVVLVVSATVLVLERSVNRQARDEWLRAAQSIPLNIAEGHGKQSLKDKNRFFEIGRGSALECAAIHDVLRVCDAIDGDFNSHGKTDLKRIVSMLTRMIQRTEAVSEGRIEYEYRDAEYEYEPTAERCVLKMERSLRRLGDRPRSPSQCGR